MSDKRIRTKHQRRIRAHWRVRASVTGTTERPRLAVFKSNRYVYAQIIDDAQGVTLAQANSAEADVRGGLEGSSATIDAARVVGELVASRALDKGVKQVVFDRGGYIYHGKVKALADAAREKGLDF
ncbi:MAG: 50S ribosomal protein L18 [Acidobacteriota bacterium]